MVRLVSARARAFPGIQRTAGAALGLFLGACASVSLEHSVDPEADFAGFRTWAWHPVRLTAVDGRVAAEPDPALTAALEEELAIRGLQRVADGEPDLLLAWNASVQRSRIGAADPPHYDYRSWNRTATGQQVTHIDEDVLVVDLVDARTNRLVWRGTARGIVHSDASGERRERRLRQALRDLLATYPPAPSVVRGG